MSKRIERPGTLQAVDAQGGLHRIDHLVEVHVNSLFGEPTTERRGMSSLRTRDGHVVNHVEEGKYQIMAGFRPIDVTSTDPAAP